MSYCPKDTLYNWDCNICSELPDIQDVRIVENKEFQSLGYVAYDINKNLLIVAIRGSENKRNWFSNFNTIPVKYEYCKDCKVHQGFLHYWNSISEGILGNLQDLKNKYPDAQLLVTGHSLGGAGANLAALQIYNDLKLRADYFVTLGQPRVGNKHYAEYLNNVFPNYIRITHNKDPVPHVPLKIMGFTHSHTEIFYDNDSEDQYKVCSGLNGEDKTCSNSLLATDWTDHVFYFGLYADCEDQPINKKQHNDLQNTEFEKQFNQKIQLDNFVYNNLDQ